MVSSLMLLCSTFLRAEKSSIEAVGFIASKGRLDLAKASLKAERVMEGKNLKQNICHIVHSNMSERAMSHLRQQQRKNSKTEL